MKDWILYVLKLIVIGAMVIDVNILLRVERFCHWTQRWFGIASAGWERLFIMLQIVAVGLKWVSLTKTVERWGMGILTVMIATDAAIRFHHSLLRTPRVGSSRTMNPLKTTMVFPRVLDLGLVCLPPPTWWFNFYTASLYLAACDDDPPGESKVKGWLKSLRPMPVPQTEAV